MNEAGPACPLPDDREWESVPPSDQATEVPAPAAATNRLDRPVDVVLDHLLGPSDAPITLVEYGSYACPYCRAANERITEVRGQLGERLRYVFRHRPLIGSELARPAAELAECAADHAQFWEAHVTLMTRSATLAEGDLQAAAEQLGLTQLEAGRAGEIRARARARVEQDIESARASGVHYTPTFFINGRRYDGPWDESSFADAMLGTLGHRVRTAALSFAAWAPSAGGLHGTLAGIILAALIPTRPPPDLKTLAMQADTILVAEAERTREQLHRGPSTPALESLDAIFDRLESPADRLLRNAAPRSSYLVLPLFALANAGVAISPDVVGRHEMLMVAILVGLVVGKPLGFVLACALAVGIGLAEKPSVSAWQQMVGAGALAGVSFTMSLFIAGQAFPAAGDFAAAKIAVLAASLVSPLLGVAVLWRAPGSTAA